METIHTQWSSSWQGLTRSLTILGLLVLQDVKYKYEVIENISVKHVK